VALSRQLTRATLGENSNLPETRRINRVHRSLSRPLTILGAERKLFFFAMCLGAATFNLLNSLLGGLLMFLLLYVVARWATQTDPQILRFLLTAARLRAEYDPMKFTPIAVRRDGHAQP
jgi:type IV secretory pathway TrbD component